MLVIRQNPSYFCRGQKDVFRPLLLKKSLDRVGVAQIQLPPAASNQMAETSALQFTPNGAADEPAMAGDVDASGWLEFHMRPTIIRGRSLQKGQMRTGK